MDDDQASPSMRTVIKIIGTPLQVGAVVDHASTCLSVPTQGISVHVHVAANREDSVRTGTETAPRGCRLWR